MVSSELLHRVVLVRTDVSWDLSTSFIRVTRVGELGGTLPVTSNWRTLRRNTKLLVTVNVVPSSPNLVILMEVLNSSETSVLTRAIRCNISEESIFRSQLLFQNPVVQLQFCSRGSKYRLRSCDFYRINTSHLTERSRLCLCDERKHNHCDWGRGYCVLASQVLRLNSLA
jgi:hypothetical protein